MTWELLAVVKVVVKHFRLYLYGMQLPTEFQYALEHRASSRYGNANGLSWQTCDDWSAMCSNVLYRSLS